MSRAPALALLSVIQFILILDAAIVTIALPSIEKDLHFAAADLSWVVNGYTLTFGGLLLLGGRLADLLGRRRLFLAGLALFVPASMSCALAPSAGWLVGSRAVQGLGAAVVAPAALSLVMMLFTEPRERYKALGLWGALAGLGSVGGTLLGGLLTEAFGWEAVFWVNVPIGAVALALAPRLLPAGAAAGGPRSFDLAGTLSVTLGLGLLVYAVVSIADAGLGSPRTLGTGSLAILLLVAFVVVETRTRVPLVPLGIFRLRALRGGNLGMGITTMAMMPAVIFLTLYMQQVLGRGPVKTALAQLPITLAIVVGTQLTPLVIGRLGYRLTLATGSLLAAAGLAWFTGLSPAGGAYPTEIAGPSVLAGVGAGMAWVSATIAATAEAPPESAGLASGLVNTSQQIGSTLGVAVLTLLATTRVEDLLEAGRPAPQALTTGYTDAMLGAAAIALAGMAVALLVVPGRGPALVPSAQGAGAGE